MTNAASKTDGRARELIRGTDEATRIEVLEHELAEIREMAAAGFEQMSIGLTTLAVRLDEQEQCLCTRHVKIVDADGRVLIALTAGTGDDDQGIVLQDESGAPLVILGANKAGGLLAVLDRPAQRTKATMQILDGHGVVSTFAADGEGEVHHLAPGMRCAPDDANVPE